MISALNHPPQSSGNDKKLKVKSKKTKVNSK